MGYTILMTSFVDINIGGFTRGGVSGGVKAYILKSGGAVPAPGCSFDFGSSR